MIPILAGLFGIGLLRGIHSQVHRFEHLAATEIGSKLSGADKVISIKTEIGPEALFGDIYRVTIYGSKFVADGLPLFTEPSRSKRGILRHLDMDFRDFYLRGLHVDRLSVSIPDSRFDLALAANKHNFRISKSGLGNATVEVTQSDLAKFIGEKFHDVTKVTVKIDRDKLFVEGHGEFLLLSTDFSVVAKMEPVDGTRLTLTHARILFDGEPTSGPGAQVLLDYLNPVVDLNRDLGLANAVHVDTLTLRNGILAASGATTIPERVPISPKKN
jgi:hypothetical protein